MEEFSRAVATRAPDLRSPEAILTAANAVLGALGTYVSGAAAETLAASLPSELSSALRGGSRQAQGGESGGFFAAVAAREATAADVAAGHVQAVFRAIAQTADPQSVRSVRDQLTSELQALLADEREGDTSQQMAAGSVEPDAPKQAGFGRPVRPDS
jgi:uncharacterized protein (DUF2267 family)